MTGRGINTQKNNKGDAMATGPTGTLATAVSFTYERLRTDKGKSD